MYNDPSLILRINIVLDTRRGEGQLLRQGMTIRDANPHELHKLNMVRGDTKKDDENGYTTNKTHMYNYLKHTIRFLPTLVKQIRDLCTKIEAWKEYTCQKHELASIFLVFHLIFNLYTS